MLLVPENRSYWITHLEMMKQCAFKTWCLPFTTVWTETTNTLPLPPLYIRQLNVRLTVWPVRTTDHIRELSVCPLMSKSNTKDVATNVGEGWPFQQCLSGWEWWFASSAIHSKPHVFFPLWVPVLYPNNYSNGPVIGSWSNGNLKGLSRVYIIMLISEDR